MELKTLFPNNLEPKWTLSKAVQINFLRPAVNWLVTRGWQMAKAGGSHWQAAGTMIECLEADRVLFPNISEVSGTDAELRDNIILIVKEIADWLCDEQFVTQSSIGHWDKRLYDTSIVVRSLLTLIVWQKERFGQSLISTSRSINCCKSGLRFLKSELIAGNIEDISKSDALSETIQVFVYAYSNFKRQFGRIMAVSPGGTSLDLVILAKEKLLAKIGDLDNKDTYSWDNVSSAVRALSALQLLETGAKIKLWDSEAEATFTRALIALEKRLPFIDGEGPSANGLGSYLRAFNIHRPNNSMRSVNQFLVLFMLHKLLLRGNVFEDGSIFHSLYATNYFVYSLNQVCQWNRSSTPLEQVYADLLSEGVEHGVLTTEREQIYQLLGDARQYQRQIEIFHLDVRRTKTFLGVAMSIAILVTVGIYIYLHNDLGPFFQTSFTVFSVVLAILIAVMSRLIPDDKHGRQ